MKKFVYLTGIIILNLFTIGAIFKVIHFPGASWLITIALTVFTLVFLPLAFMDAYKGETDRSYFWIYLMGFICIFICSAGALFKIQHYPGASILLYLSLFFPFLVFLPVFASFHIRNKDRNLPNFLGVMLLLTYIVVFSALLALRS